MDRVEKKKVWPKQLRRWADSFFNGQTIILLFAIVVTSMVCVSFFKQALIDDTKSDLQETLMMTNYLIQRQQPPIASWCTAMPKRSTSRITVIDSNGKVWCDSAVGEGLENHLDRPEIQEAIKNGAGFDIRVGKTLSQEMSYGAIRVQEENGMQIFLRLAEPIEVIQVLVHRIQFSLILVLIPLILTLSGLSLWIGQRRELEERKRHEKLKEDLIANISHEVRTPLTALKGYVQVLQSWKSRFPADILPYLQRIENNAERLNILFRDILELSVLERPQTLVLERISLSDLQDRVISSIKQAYSHKELEIHTLYSLENLTVDVKIVEQLVTNLLENAFKYTPSGGKIFLEWKRTDHHFAQFSVKDTGIGIPPEHLPRIFERFYRVDVSRSREMGGTGLGLAIVKHAVKLLGGRIWVESQVGVGSTFFVELPICGPKMLS